jgi:hypothetical protein
MQHCPLIPDVTRPHELKEYIWKTNPENCYTTTEKYNDLKFIPTSRNATLQEEESI